MKNYILFALIIANALSGFCQKKEELEIKEFFWGANDKYKNVTEISDEFKNESAVIIYKNENYDFHKFGKKVTYIRSIRKRIKLLDNAAVKEFSEFAFKKRFKSRNTWKTKGSNVVGIKIVKPDGKEIEIDVNIDAVEVDGEHKIAISNLEVGDIVDYYYHKTEPFKSATALGFDPVETTLNEEYPIINFKLFFESENDFFLNFNSYNGAPDLKKIPTEKKNLRRYILEASNIQKSTSTRWFYPLVELPSYKFQVYFARSVISEKDARGFLPEHESIIKKNVTTEEVKKYYDWAFENGSLASSSTKSIKKYFKDKTFSSDTEKVIEAYYFMRHNYFNQYIEDTYAYDADIISSYSPVIDRKETIVQRKVWFFTHFKSFLNRHDIGYETIFVKKRYDGSMDDLLIAANVSRILKVNTAEPLYIDFYKIHKSIGTLSPLIEGNNAYLFTSKKKKVDKVVKTNIPVSSYLTNETKKSISITINDDFSELSLSLLNSYKGHPKTTHQGDRLIFSDYIYKDHKKYGTTPFLELLKLNKKKKAIVKDKFEAIIEKLKTNQKKLFIKYAKNEFDVKDIEDYTYNIKDNGRYGFDTYFTFLESFKIKDKFIKKAGPNYIIEIGKLIGGQVDLTEKERNRTGNIHMAYPRSFNHEIKMEIPTGYMVSGIDKLKKSIDNSTGAFISTAKIEGNTLVINTSKQYKNNYESNSNWNLMVDFLDAANQFTNEKILLKKK